MRGVCLHPRDKIFLPYVIYQKRYVWLKTYRDEESAGRVRDVAYYWLHGKTLRQNYPDLLVPDDTTPGDILRFLLDGGIPLKALLPRLAKSTLIQAGITRYDLLLAGVSIADLAAYESPVAG